jgi:cytidylate kinase
MGSIESIIERQLRRWEMERRKRDEEARNGLKTQPKPIITISRQKGSRGGFFAERLAEQLGYQLLYREIIDEICNSSGYRRQVIESLDDRVRSRIELWIDGAFKGMYVDASDYLKHLYRVIMSISEHGGVVVVGRGANFIIKQEQGFSIRVVASLSRRIENLVLFQKLAREEAEKEIKSYDRARADFIHSHFKRDIDEPGAYDMIINTNNIEIETAVKMAQIGIRAKWGEADGRV